MPSPDKQIILITGAAGKIGSRLARAFRKEYTVIGLDQKPCADTDGDLVCDLTDESSIRRGFDTLRSDYGADIAAVIHLAAYFDFTGKKSPLYEKVNSRGTRHIMTALQDFNVDRFIYASTMLVHAPGVPGQKINEEHPIAPKWAYPQSKADTEEIILQSRGDIPCTILRLAGLYDAATAVPTLSHQIARVYERDVKSHLYAGDLLAGQSFIHQEDMTDLFLRVVERRHDLPAENIMLAGEKTVLNYQEIQNRLGHLIFGEADWQTINIPPCIAKPAAWLEHKAEPVIPDDFDGGEPPFIRPFMIDLAADHYDLDIRRAETLLDWVPRHNIYEGLAHMVAQLQKDPAAWYSLNRITPPDWIAAAEEKNAAPEELRAAHEADYRETHRQNLWAHFLNLGLAVWLISGPVAFGYQSPAMIWSDIAAGVLLAVFSLLSLSWRMGFARFACGAVGFWLLCAPLVFWAPTAAAYLNNTIVGMLVIGFALLTRPPPGVSAVAARTGPTIPPGWDYSPSGWYQRVPIIGLAFIGFVISRYLTAYQLGHIDGVWEPFFQGAPDPKNGTEEIITSAVSKAWPVPDAGLGALTYALEILTGIMGSARRWRTMPWLVILFGIMIVPLGIISITFIIIQPIVIGTWCTLCLIAAAAMLLQIPYSIDEIVATCQFLNRRRKKGRPLLRIFFTGDTDDGAPQRNTEDFTQSPKHIICEMAGGGISLPWNLLACMLIGIWLMLTRLSLGTADGMAHADHLIGALVVTIAITAVAEAARSVRFLIAPLGMALLVLPFIYETPVQSVAGSIFCGLALMALCLPRGAVNKHYGSWDRYII